MERNIVKSAINSMKEAKFNCMPMPQYRDKEYKFEKATHDMAAEANCHLEWMDTFKGGCWHVIPN